MRLQKVCSLVARCFYCVHWMPAASMSMTSDPPVTSQTWIYMTNASNAKLLDAPGSNANSTKTDKTVFIAPLAVTVPILVILCAPALYWRMKQPIQDILSEANETPMVLMQPTVQGVHVAPMVPIASFDYAQPPQYIGSL